MTAPSLPPLTPGYSPATIDQFRDFSAHVYGKRPRLWPVTDRETGRVDCVIGPCGVDEMIETFQTIEGGQRVRAEIKVTFNPSHGLPIYRGHR